MDSLLVLKDTIAVNMHHAVDTCKVCVLEAPTNCNDVKITIIICGTIVTAFLIAAVALLLYFGLNWIRQCCQNRTAFKNSLKEEYQKELLLRLRNNPDDKSIEELRNFLKALDSSYNPVGGDYAQASGRDEASDS